MDRALIMYVIYDHPRDFPRYVVRRWRTDHNGSFADLAYDLARTLEQARQLIPPGLVCLDRNPDDDTAIAEVWL